MTRLEELHCSLVEIILRYSDLKNSKPILIEKFRPVMVAETVKRPPAALYTHLSSLISLATSPSSSSFFNKITQADTRRTLLNYVLEISHLLKQYIDNEDRNEPHAVLNVTIRLIDFIKNLQKLLLLSCHESLPIIIEGKEEVVWGLCGSFVRLYGYTHAGMFVHDFLKKYSLDPEHHTTPHSIDRIITEIFDEHQRETEGKLTSLGTVSATPAMVESTLQAHIHSSPEKGIFFSPIYQRMKTLSDNLKCDLPLEFTKSLDTH